MSSADPEHNLTPAERDDLVRLEAVAQHGLESYVQVGRALVEIRDRHLYRDTHPSFEAYLRERWDTVNTDPLSQHTIRAGGGTAPAGGQEPGTALRSAPCEALAKACEQTLSALDGDERVDIEVRLVVRKLGDPSTPADGQSLGSPEVAEPMGRELLPNLRWLLTQASGTIGAVANELETRAVDIDDEARAQLRDDIVVLEGELAVVKSLLTDVIDWDAEFSQLLTDESPPPEADADPEGDG